MLRFIILLVILLLAAAAWSTWRRERQRRELAIAEAEFARRRDKLQEDFRAAGNVSGKPRGLRWKSCELVGPLVLARDRSNGKLVGLSGATIGFEAVAGGGMEDVEAVGNLRAATAIFTWSGIDWTTTGHTVFNLEPQQVLEHYHASLAAATG